MFEVPLDKREHPKQQTQVTPVLGENHRCIRGLRPKPRDINPANLLHQGTEVPSIVLNNSLGVLFLESLIFCCILIPLQAVGKIPLDGREPFRGKRSRRAER